MAVLSLESVHKTYDDRHLLRGVSLVVGGGERIGLVGPNGSGKSTLLRILAGDEPPDAGTRVARRDLRIGWLRQAPDLSAELSVRDAVRQALGARDGVLERLEAVHAALADEDDPAALERLLSEQADLEQRLDALGGHDVDHRVDAVLAHVGLSAGDAPCGRLSGGEQRRVALARLLLSDPELMLLDEPTNHLDAEVIGWLEETLVQRACAMVLVTHDRYFLDRVVSRIVEVDRGVLHAYEGGYADFLEQRAERLAREQRESATRLNLLRREAAWMRRGPPARTTKSKARIQRFRALEDAAPEAAAAELQFRIPCSPRLGEKVLNLRAVRKGFDGRLVIDGLDLEVTRGQRVGIVGPNGAGKSTFLRLCLGLETPDSGEIELGPTVRPAFVDQARLDLDPEKTVFEEVGGGNDHVAVDGRKVRIEGFLESMLFPATLARTRIGALSGGERNRVLLAKLLARGGNLLVLDEPTNDLDLMTLRVLEEALIAYEGALLVVSHDRWFLDRVATRIVRFDRDDPVPVVWDGDLSLLLERLRAAARERDEAARASAAAERSARREARLEERAAAEVRRLSWAERRELDDLPERITALEEALERLDATLADPSTWASDAQRAGRIAAERAEQAAALERLYARWEELERIAAP